MTHQVRAARDISVAANDLWQTIHRMTGMEEWYPGLIARSEVLNEGRDQPLRTCVMQNGGELIERVMLRDDKTRTFVYAIDSHPLPAKNVVGTIRIDTIEDGASHVVWSANMVLDPATADEVKAVVQTMYQEGLKALEVYHAS